MRAGVRRVRGARARAKEWSAFAHVVVIGIRDLGERIDRVAAHLDAIAGRRGVEGERGVDDDRPPDGP